ncbi:unnamed protein product [Notodromas monacha]|uniref:Uncharacterized protein n=1 Tax=Notodromas monacha TaxID=399045 RepID=A0A7R9BU72_9CRUS|nr:unnamed protein product [Notodromas monacha]CAG0920272.1 unnamed protein product [Notodromas monacha]
MQWKREFPKRRIPLCAKFRSRKIDESEKQRPKSVSQRDEEVILRTDSNAPSPKNARMSQGRIGAAATSTLHRLGTLIRSAKNKASVSSATAAISRKPSLADDERVDIVDTDDVYITQTKKTGDDGTKWTSLGARFRSCRGPATIRRLLRRAESSATTASRAGQRRRRHQQQQQSVEDATRNDTFDDFLHRHEPASTSSAVDGFLSIKKKGKPSKNNCDDVVGVGGNQKSQFHTTTTTMTRGMRRAMEMQLEVF